MRLWAAGIVYVYMGLHVFNWVTGLAWLGDVSLPLALVAGLSLAIASQPDQTEAAVSTDDDASPAIIQEPEPQPVTNKVSAPDDSISFTIRKNIRPQ